MRSFYFVEVILLKPINSSSLRKIICMCVLQIDRGRALVVLLKTEGNGATGHKGRNEKVTVRNNLLSKHLLPN